MKNVLQYIRYQTRSAPCLLRGTLQQQSSFASLLSVFAVGVICSTLQNRGDLVPCVLPLLLVKP